MERSKSLVCFFVNGRKETLENPEPYTTLLYYLRKILRLTGTKEACGEGGCGSCTVMISKYDCYGDKIRHWSVNACLIPICTLDGLAVTTIEGIGSTRNRIHPCQESIACGHGSQCGYCTPGMVMSIYTLLHNNQLPKENDIEEALHGNLCRCTGYRSILDSFRKFCHNDSKIDSIAPEQEVIFPPELKLIKEVTPLYVHGSMGIEWYRPINMEQLSILKEDIPHSQLVAGGLSLGLEINKGNIGHNSVYIALSHIPDLNIVKETNEGLLVGAMVTISQLEKQLKKTIQKLPEAKIRRLKALLKMLSLYAGPQIKNVATIGGNVMSSSSDVRTVLVGVKATLNIVSKRFQKDITLNSAVTFPQLDNNEILISILIPLSEENDHIAVFKQTRRKHLDTAIVNACFCLTVEQKGLIITNCCLAFGGLNTKGTTMAVKTEQKIKGRKLNDDLLSFVCHSLVEELLPKLDTNTKMADYRISLCLSFFYKFYLEVLSSIDVSTVSERNQSGLRALPCEPIKGTQEFQQVSDHVIGQPLMHLSALEQATGEAKYVDDIPCIDGEGFAGLVLSEAAHAYFTVDYSGLKGMKGIIGYVSAQDVPNCNVSGLENDELIFADKKVTSVGQLIAMVIAKKKQLAQRAVKAIKVEYTHLPAILTMEEAIAVNSFYKPDKCIINGNVNETFKSTDYVKEGEMRLGGQEHFYMETFSCLVIPKGEHNEIEILASTQSLSQCQNFVAKALGIPKNRIKVKTNRLGGGFGGKETHCNVSYTAAAVAANKFQIPVRMIMSRKEDMRYSGGRHSFLGKYKVGFTKEGKLEALDIDLYLNGGSSADVSLYVAEMAMLSIQSVYYVPHANIRGHVCRTNLPSNTAMRGFGAPEALLIMETILSHVADTLKVEDKVKIQELNFLKDGQEFVYGAKVENITISRCMDTLLKKCQYMERQEEVKEYNKKNRWKKRGIGVVPTVQGMIAISRAAGALVHVYTDGSVLLTHGGIEMGQGLHTKMTQVCAKCLNIPIEKIHICETSTDKVPNATVTSASVSADYNGIAVQDACEQIISSIKPFKEQNPNGTWEEWIEAAYIGRASLSARGICKPPKNIYTFTEDGLSRGTPYLYYTYGVGCSIVEVDTLTGSSQILRTDLLMDVGNSLNPAIDIGQVEGAFTQGLGLFTMEELLFSSTDGQLCTDGPNTYKIPGCSDVPIELNVSLLDRCPNPKAIFCSKGIGEPPLFLAASVFFAIKEAVKSARAERGITNYFEFSSPATTEMIRLACQDQFTDMVKDKCNPK